MPRLKLSTSRLLSVLTLGAAGTIGAFQWWTQDCQFVPYEVSRDVSLSGSAFYRRFNPNQNPAFQDLCVRRIPLSRLDPKLLRDYEEGGTKLIEAYCAGIWASRAYTIQRRYLQQRYSSPTTAHQLWRRSELLHSPYDVGTEITNHFVVLSKTPASILLRCGDSPLNTPHGPRDVDGLFEMSIATYKDEGVAEFRMKSLFYHGVGKVSVSPIRQFSLEGWAHKRYVKLLLEEAVQGCCARQSWRSDRYASIASQEERSRAEGTRI
ncbi:uncharacterized protein Z520_02191 [Fonsecaea multimorphosa CBS 102226]|uniref:Uncharacterized protein n=1 Tax=Fonsecaea multimorphosa CBS 102226 TaxID=1442371 RepID=A0A0D2K7N8_9EURO|nr:uncharacterized protein Z520_02191 [Fonsecaea multimorphosa CBS 102226]KIY02053.1 hypothetical protein Z520_02191 [Fonsecaea multimorphosa CBS 102226]OAL29253.1 hypothetical protein AYO22_02147 [Fonsecaea multimorphosa]